MADPSDSAGRSSGGLLGGFGAIAELSAAILKPDMFIRVTGKVSGKVKGEWDRDSQALKVGDIQILSWSWGVRSPTDPWEGTATGRRQFLELQVHKRVDTSTPVLYSILKTNEALKSVRLMVFKAGSDLEDLPYFILTISEARITSMATSPGDGQEAHELFDRMSFAFRKVQIGYNAQLPDGSLGPEIQYEDTLEL
jgi:type VI secretion system secreted protein Hcp